MGYQVKGYYESALRKLGEKQVINNMVKVIASLKSGEKLTTDEKNITTAADLLTLFKRKPGLLQAFRNKLMHEPESQQFIFEKGTDYTKVRVEQVNNEAERDRENLDLATQYIDKFAKNFPEEYEEFSSQLKEKYEQESEFLKTDINTQIGKIAADMKKYPNDTQKQKTGTEMIDQLKDILASLEDTGKLTASDWKEMTKSWIVP
jgi:hypothetical protein